MGFQHNNGADEPKLKIGPDGKPFDPAAKAREAHRELRRFIEGVTVADPVTRKYFTEALNAVGDRLQTADALEQLIAKKNAG
jgi:hypothetical protein